MIFHNNYEWSLIYEYSVDNFSAYCCSAGTMDLVAFVGQKKEDSGDFQSAGRDTSIEGGAGCLDESGERRMTWY